MHAGTPSLRKSTLLAKCKFWWRNRGREREREETKTQPFLPCSGMSNEQREPRLSSQLPFVVHPTNKNTKWCDWQQEDFRKKKTTAFLKKKKFYFESFMLNRRSGSLVHCECEHKCFYFLIPTRRKSHIEIAALQINQ